MSVRRQVRPRLAAVLAERAHGMRQAPTESESALWRGLSGSKLGVAFRRQVPVDRFVVDFLAACVGVILEVDGGYHTRREKADARRQRRLEQLGFVVLRLDAELVLKQPAEAIERVKHVLRQSAR